MRTSPTMRRNGPHQRSWTVCIPIHGKCARPSGPKAPSKRRRIRLPRAGYAAQTASGSVLFSIFWKAEGAKHDRETLKYGKSLNS